SPLSTTTLHPPSLHDALPISNSTHLDIACRESSCERGGTAEEIKLIEIRGVGEKDRQREGICACGRSASVLPESNERDAFLQCRSEEHTSELQSRENLVCRLL